MSHYKPSGFFVEDFSNDFSDEFSHDYDAAFADWDAEHEDYESYYQELLESGALPSPEEVAAQTESFLARAGVPQLNGSHLVYFNEAQLKAESCGISVWEYLGLDSPY